MTNSPLWSPSKEQIKQTNINQFQSFLEERFSAQNYQSGDRTYEALHKWSVENKASFWRAIWDYFDVVGEGQGLTLQDENQMPGAKWFSDYELNFAENLLKNSSDSPAIIEHGESGLRLELTFAELHHLVAQLAQWLASHGVGKGDRVAAFLPNSHYAIVGMLATASLGAVWSSCSPDFGLQGVLDRFQQIEPKVIIGTNGYIYNGKRIETADRLNKIIASIPSLKGMVLAPYLKTKDKSIDSELLASFVDTHVDCMLWDAVVSVDKPAPDLHFERVAFDSPLYILYSSGTTGKPKCIVHSVGGTLLQHLKELSLHSDLKAGERIFYFTTCGWMMWNWLVSALALDATVVLFDGSPFSPSQDILFNIADQESVTIFGASAKYYAACEKFGLKPRETHKLNALKAMLSTGSPLSHESFEYLYRDVKNDMCLSSISGGTDIVSCFALGCPILPVYKGELQCLGLGMDVSFYDETGKAVSSGKGELVCQGPFPSMPTGFWNDTDGEKYHSAYFDVFDNTWAHGDYGELTTHTSETLGTHHGVIIHGRSDAVLNPGGVRIGTAEIYRQVEKIDEVFESIAVGQTWQDDVRIVLFVRLKENITLDDALIEQIKHTIRANTTPRHVPAKIIQIGDIPRTLSGKIVEIAVRKVIHGEEVKNTEALANPEALELYKNLIELNE